MTEKNKTPKAEAPKKAAAKEEVSVPRDLLEELMESNRAMKESNETLERNVDVLRKAANKNKLRDVERELDEDERPRMKLRVFRGRVVHSWRGADETEATMGNQVLQNGNVFVGESVKMHVAYFDKDEGGAPMEEIVDYSDMNKASRTAFFREVGRRRAEEKGKPTRTILTGEFEDLELREQYGQFEIGIEFVNP